jgi:hypothetical protein
MAIVNTERMERFASIPEHERRLAENLVFSDPPTEVPGRSFTGGAAAVRSAGGLARAEQGTAGSGRAVLHRYSSQQRDCRLRTERTGIFRSLSLNQANRRRRWTPNSVSIPIPRRMMEDGSGAGTGSVTTTVTKPEAKWKVPKESTGAESDPVNIRSPFNCKSIPFGRSKPKPPEMDPVDRFENSRSKGGSG